MCRACDAAVLAILHSVARPAKQARVEGAAYHRSRCTLGNMAIWGWALLPTRLRLVEWHKVVLAQDTERESWLRYLTACRLNLEAEEIQPVAKPGRDPVCSICNATAD
jgi:hypothetical protein